MPDMELNADRMREIEKGARELLQSIDLSNAATTSLNWELTAEIRQLIVCCEKIGDELRRRDA